MHEWFDCMYVHLMPWKVRRGHPIPAARVMTAVNHLVVAENWTRVLCESNKCSQPLNCLSSPPPQFITSKWSPRVWAQFSQILCSDGLHPTFQVEYFSASSTPWSQQCPLRYVHFSLVFLSSEPTPELPSQCAYSSPGLPTLTPQIPPIYACFPLPKPLTYLQVFIISVSPRRGTNFPYYSVFHYFNKTLESGYL